MAGAARAVGKWGAWCASWTLRACDALFSGLVGGAGRALRMSWRMLGWGGWGKRRPCPPPPPPLPCALAMLGSGAR